VLARAVARTSAPRVVPLIFYSTGSDLHKRRNQLAIKAEDGTIAERRIVTSRERFTAVLGGWAPARILAEACRLGACRAVHRASAAQRHVRAQLAVRDTLIRTRTRYVRLTRLSRANSAALRTLGLLALVAALASGFASTHASGPDDRELSARGRDNVVAFARLTGYVRFFHPSDEGARTDWDRFTVSGSDAQSSARRLHGRTRSRHATGGRRDGLVRRPALLPVLRRCRRGLGFDAGTHPHRRGH
jgi:hypothetical protein